MQALLKTAAMAKLEILSRFIFTSHCSRFSDNFLHDENTVPVEKFRVKRPNEYQTVADHCKSAFLRRAIFCGQKFHSSIGKL